MKNAIKSLGGLIAFLLLFVFAGQSDLQAQNLLQGDQAKAIVGAASKQILLDMETAMAEEDDFSIKMESEFLVSYAIYKEMYYHLGSNMETLTALESAITNATVHKLLAEFSDEEKKTFLLQVGEDLMVLLQN